MVKDYMRFLAVHVINESKTISYRMLSRELKVHCNAAKRMLYEFHTHENKKKPGSVHATYLLYGTQGAKSSPTNGASQRDGEDISMTSSPFMSSMPEDEDMLEEPPVKVMTVVREENLEAVKAKYEEILSIHIYSLSPSPLNNIQLLSDCNRQIATKFLHEDPLVFNEKYGVIKNPGVKRRTGPRPPPPPAIIEPTNPTSYRPEPKKPDTTTKPVKAPEKPISAPAPKPETKPSTQPKPLEKKPPEKKPTLKKDTSNLFKSFGKTKAPTPKLSKEETDTSTMSVGASGKEDEPMRDASESEHEEDFMPSTASSKPKPRSTRPSKNEREETLRKMMEEDSDEEMSNAPSKEETPPPPAPPAKEKTPTPEPAATVAGGRRRGRRKVLRKKTVKDEEGYLITREEPTWESFSEDEPPPQPTKRVQLPTSSTSAATASSGRGGKKGPGGGGGPKAGQGNIMNFFGKK